MTDTLTDEITLDDGTKVTLDPDTSTTATTKVIVVPRSTSGSILTMTLHKSPSVGKTEAMTLMAGLAAAGSQVRTFRLPARRAFRRPVAFREPVQKVTRRQRSQLGDLVHRLRLANDAYNVTAPRYRKRTTKLRRLRQLAKRLMASRG